MINTEVKGTLAKLLATENLTVEHRKVSTAYFDVDERVLCLPIWERASSTVYDLLVGHEVGHALYTPSEDYSDAPKAFMNVLEDARIERMMKQTYPGLRQTFFEGYKELWEDNFFGVSEEELPYIPFIDRINLYFKGNSLVEFSDEEMPYVVRAGQTKTFREVVDLAVEIYEFSKQKQEEKDEDFQAPPEQDNDSNTTADDEVQVGNTEDEDKEWPTESDPESDHRNDRDFSDDGDPDLDTPSYSQEETGGSDFDETESITDSALQESLSRLISDDAKEWIYLDLPQFNYRDFTEGYDDIQKDLKKWFDRSVDGFVDTDTYNYFHKNVAYAVDKYTSFKKDAQKSVNYLVKQFEMKKSADEYKRSATSKTGVIDTNKLFKYKLTDDIFKKVTVVPEGKNHGLVMYLDWSGSMQYQLLDTLKQTYNLIWFCRKANIPFRVYGFQSGLRPDQAPPVNHSRGTGITLAEDFKLFEFFSSRQNRQSLDESMRLVWTQVFAFAGHRIPYCNKYTLGGTPLVEAVLCTRQIAQELKKVEQVQKVTIISLTDGESNPMMFAQKIDASHDYLGREYKNTYLCHQISKVFILRDPVTGYSRKINPSAYYTTREIVSFYREITDYNWVGIRICNKGELTRLIRCLDIQVDEGAIDKQWRKEKFASLKNVAGFAESFYMPDKNTGMGTAELSVNQKSEVATKTELTRAFKKHMGSKMMNKTVLNAFIDQIA
jgi:hypothetical protein|tara:strand:- start:615 stop:2774 length:2160 start_codon:yes stop_codon:yes gene_type:complete